MTFIDYVSIAAQIFSAINIIAAMYYMYRHALEPSPKNLHNAQFHWAISGIFVAVAALTDNTLSTPATVIITIGALIAPIAPIAYLRRIHAQRYSTFLDRIAADDIIDRTRNRE
ncbi:hypothetical protein [Rhodococcoides fascians]|uniref:hypothetical protein n=1 Tax=Rhodococcoides fascians TaxID=1828 RepID=UPI00056D2732|nr:hypothetical protein [Rhodococcus fascians]